MIGLALFVGVVIAILIVALAVGMLVAGRVTAWLDRADEDPDER